jgi:hypothetical protein
MPFILQATVGTNARLLHGAIATHLVLAYRHPQPSRQLFCFPRFTDASTIGKEANRELPAPLWA